MCPHTPHLHDNQNVGEDDGGVELKAVNWLQPMSLHFNRQDARHHLQGHLARALGGLAHSKEVSLRPHLAEL